MAGNLYETLGVAPDASADAIRQAFLVRSKIMHPDRFQQATQPKEWEQANELFKQLNHAYSILSNATARAEYDRTIAVAGNTTPEPWPQPAPRAASPPRRRLRDFWPVYVVAILVSLAAGYGLREYLGKTHSGSGSWPRFTLPGTSFSISSPSELVDHQRMIDAPQGRIKVEEYEATSGGIRYAVSSNAASAANDANQKQWLNLLAPEDTGHVVLSRTYDDGAGGTIIAFVSGRRGAIPNADTNRFFDSVDYSTPPTAARN